MKQDDGRRTVEVRLARVETKTDRLLKDVAEHRAETRTEFKELRGIVEANESAIRNDMHKEIKDSENNLLQEIKASENSLLQEIKASENSLRQEINASENSLPQEINASENSLRIQMTRNTEAVFEIRSYVKVLLAFVLPMALAVFGYLVKGIFGD